MAPLLKLSTSVLMSQLLSRRGKPTQPYQPPALMLDLPLHLQRQLVIMAGSSSRFCLVRLLSTAMEQCLHQPQQLPKGVLVLAVFLMHAWQEETTVMKT